MWIPNQRIRWIIHDWVKTRVVEGFRLSKCWVWNEIIGWLSYTYRLALGHVVNWAMVLIPDIFVIAVLLWSCACLYMLLSRGDLHICIYIYISTLPSSFGTLQQESPEVSKSMTLQFGMHTPRLAPFALSYPTFVSRAPTTAQWGSGGCSSCMWRSNEGLLSALHG